MVLSPLYCCCGCCCVVVVVVAVVVVAAFETELDFVCSLLVEESEAAGRVRVWRGGVDVILSDLYS